MEKRGERLFRNDAVAVVVATAHAAQHAGERHVGARSAGEYAGKVKHFLVGREPRRRFPRVACRLPVGGARRLADDHDEERLSVGNDFERRALVHDDAPYLGVGILVGEKRRRRRIDNVDGSDLVAKRLVVSHGARETLHAEKNGACADE